MEQVKKKKFAIFITIDFNSAFDTIERSHMIKNQKNTSDNSLAATPSTIKLDFL